MAVNFSSSEGISMDCNGVFGKLLEDNFSLSSSKPD
jgi:hypothetical protein